MAGNRQQRRHPGKPRGMSYADTLARERLHREVAQNAANDVVVKIRADIQAQKTMYLVFLSLNDEFQFGESRYERLAKRLIKRSEWYEKMVEENDEDYAIGKLQAEIERVTHQEVELAWEEEIRAAQKKHANDRMTNFLRLRSSEKELAEFICNHTECHVCPGQSFCNATGEKANGLVEWLGMMEEVRGERNG